MTNVLACVNKQDSVSVDFLVRVDSGAAGETLRPPLERGNDYLLLITEPSVERMFFYNRRKISPTVTIPSAVREGKLVVVKKSLNAINLLSASYEHPLDSATALPTGDRSLIFSTFFSAPSFAPSGLTVEEANGTTFNVSWRPLPRNQSNGEITDYEVSYGYTSQKRRRRADSRADVQAKTSKTWILLTGLVSCRKYAIKVRAYTSVAPGPYSDPQTRTTAGERSLCRNGSCECLDREEGAWAPVLSFPLTRDVIHSANCAT